MAVVLVLIVIKYFTLTLGPIFSFLFTTKLVVFYLSVCVYEYVPIIIISNKCPLLQLM